MIFPSFWECGGGQVHKGESFIEAVKYHMKEEFGLNVEVLFPVCTYTINLPNKVIPGIRFVCHLKDPQDIHIDGEEIVDHKWILPSELKHFNLIPGLSDDVLLAVEYYKKLI
jgi:8-oxo-dGTP pyrophosphatase MutT (NUDIX family)